MLPHPWPSIQIIIITHAAIDIKLQAFWHSCESGRHRLCID